REEADESEGEQDRPDHQIVVKEAQLVHARASALSTSWRRASSTCVSSRRLPWMAMEMAPTSAASSKVPATSTLMRCWLKRTPPSRAMWSFSPKTSGGWDGLWAERL